VLPLTDRLAGVGAMISRTLAKGILKGTGESQCQLSYLDYGADVREGDLVVTSGDSEIFPRGLVLGHVVSIARDPRYSSLTATIEPAVAFDRLSAVYVRIHPR
jgi:rod shape-determining protein MreC